MNEHELERIAQRLGDRAAAGLDVDRTAAGVLARLRTSERTVRWWSSPVLLRLAAILTLTAGAGLFAYRTLSNGSIPDSVGPAAPPVVALQTLSSDELEEVLDSLTVEAPAHEQVAVGLYDLNDEQLGELLQRMEG